MKIVVPNLVAFVNQQERDCAWVISRRTINETEAIFYVFITGYDPKGRLLELVIHAGSCLRLDQEEGRKLLEKQKQIRLESRDYLKKKGYRLVRHGQVCEDGSLIIGEYLSEEELQQEEKGGQV